MLVTSIFSFSYKVLKRRFFKVIKIAIVWERANLLSLDWISFIILSKTFQVNPLPNNKILARSKLKAFADGKLNIKPSIKFDFMGQKTGKKENVYHFPN